MTFEGFLLFVFLFLCFMLHIKLLWICWGKMETKTHNTICESRRTLKNE